MQNEEGLWYRAAAGKYEIDGDVLKETVLYSTTPGHAGTSHEWKYAFEGDKLIITGPFKMHDADGNDISSRFANFGKLREVRVRAR